MGRRCFSLLTPKKRSLACLRRGGRLRRRRRRLVKKSTSGGGCRREGKAPEHRKEMVYFLASLDFPSSVFLCVLFADDDSGPPPPSSSLPHSSRISCLLRCRRRFSPFCTVGKPAQKNLFLKDFLLMSRLFMLQLRTFSVHI